MFIIHDCFISKGKSNRWRFLMKLVNRIHGFVVYISEIRLRTMLRMRW